LIVEHEWDLGSFLHEPTEQCRIRRIDGDEDAIEANVPLKVLAGTPEAEQGT
jgi:hypothetical protein